MAKNNIDYNNSLYYTFNLSLLFEFSYQDEGPKESIVLIDMVDLVQYDRIQISIVQKSCTSINMINLT